MEIMYVLDLSSERQSFLLIPIRLMSEVNLVVLGSSSHRLHFWREQTKRREPCSPPKLVTVCDVRSRV